MSYPPKEAAPNRRIKYIKKHSGKPLPYRAIRLMMELLKGPVDREKADRTAPASNSPHYVMLIRRRLKIDIECERVPYTTEDGEQSWYGRYITTPEERQVIRDYLQSAGVEL